MPRIKTIDNLVTLCQQRADMEYSELISDGEWRSMLSSAYGEELYATCAATGFRYWEREDPVTTTGAATYTLPDEHFSTIGVDYQYTGSHRRALQEQMVQERNDYEGVTGSEAKQYTLVGRHLRLQPVPPAGQVYYHLYVPQPVDFAAALGQQASRAGNTITLASASDIRNIRIGDVLSASPNADKTSPRVGTTSVTGYDRGAGTIDVADATAITSLADGDYLFLHELDVVTPGGESLLVWAVTVLALSKEETDTRNAVFERNRAKSMVEEHATLRAMNEPRRPQVGPRDWSGDLWAGEYLDRRGGGW
jgi:hypothetical protein